MYLNTEAPTRPTNLNVASDGFLFDQSTGWTHLKSIRLPEENASSEDAFLRSVALCFDSSSLKEKQHLLLDEFARVWEASNFEIVLARN